MKITNVETIVLAVPLDRPIFFATRAVRKRDLSITKIHTDEGIVGLNCVPIGEPLSVMSIIERKLKPLFISEDPLSVPSGSGTRCTWRCVGDRKGSAIRGKGLKGLAKERR